MAQSRKGREFQTSGEIQHQYWFAPRQTAIHRTAGHHAVEAEATGLSSWRIEIDDQAHLVRHPIRVERDPGIRRPLKNAAPTVGKARNGNDRPSAAAIMANPGDCAPRATVRPTVLLPDCDNVHTIGWVDVDPGFDLGACIIGPGAVYLTGEITAIGKHAVRTGTRDLYQRTGAQGSGVEDANNIQCNSDRRTKSQICRMASCTACA